MDEKEYIGINPIQKLNLELIRLSTFNEMNGEKVVKDLLAHQDLWRGVVMDRADYNLGGQFNTTGEMICLIKLRDIEDGYWNVDTLYILPKEGKEKELERLAKGWNADEVDYEGEEWSRKHLGGGKGNVLRVWWD